MTAYSAILTSKGCTQTCKIGYMSATIYEKSHIDVITGSSQQLSSPINPSREIATFESISTVQPVLINTNTNVYTTSIGNNIVKEADQQRPSMNLNIISREDTPVLSRG